MRLGKKEFKTGRDGPGYILCFSYGFHLPTKKGGEHVQIKAGTGSGTFTNIFFNLPALGLRHVATCCRGIHRWNTKTYVRLMRMAGDGLSTL